MTVKGKNLLFTLKFCEKMIIYNTWADKKLSNPIMKALGKVKSKITSPQPEKKTAPIKRDFSGNGLARITDNSNKAIGKTFTT